MKKFIIKEDKKEDEKSMQNKTVRMFNFFSVLLSSFAVYIDKPSGIFFLNSPRKKRMKKFTYYVGSGNNKNLIVSILKKRWWWA